MHSRVLPRVAAFTAFALAVLLTGCIAEGPAEPAAAPTASDTVRYAAPGSPSVATNDPHGFLPGESDLVRMALTYDVLTLPGPDGETLPRLATAWEPDDTLTRWRVTIRDDATFSDGRPVHAVDALFSLRRMGEKSAENFGRLSMFDLPASRVVDDTTMELVTVEPYAAVGLALEGFTFVVPEGSHPRGARGRGAPGLIVDANVLLYARNHDDPRHERARDWLEAALNGDTRVGLPWQTLTAFLADRDQPARLPRLVGMHDVRGPLVTDAQLAALAIDHGVAPISTDADFARFAEVRWSTPSANWSLLRGCRRPRRRRTAPDGGTLHSDDSACSRLAAREAFGHGLDIARPRHRGGMEIAAPSQLRTGTMTLKVQRQTI